MKQGLLYKFLIAPLIFLLLYIGTILPFIGESMRVLLQFLPQLLASAISLFLTILAAIQMSINSFLAFFSPSLAEMFSSASNAIVLLVSSIFNILAQLFGSAVDLAQKSVSSFFNMLGHVWSAFASIIIQLLNLLGFLAEALLAFLSLLVQLLLYALQTLLSSLFAITYKVLSVIPGGREFIDYLLNTPAGRLLREFFGLFLNRTHRQEARYAWQNFLKKIKRKGL
ncbi:MAG: hypothetical protein ACRC8T_02105 [Acidaminococcaceae bacterium]